MLQETRIIFAEHLGPFRLVGGGYVTAPRSHEPGFELLLHGDVGVVWDAASHALCELGSS